MNMLPALWIVFHLDKSFWVEYNVAQETEIATLQSFFFIFTLEFKHWLIWTATANYTSI